MSPANNNNKSIWAFLFCCWSGKYNPLCWCKSEMSTTKSRSVTVYMQTNQTSWRENNRQHLLLRKWMSLFLFYHYIICMRKWICGVQPELRLLWSSFWHCRQDISALQPAESLHRARHTHIWLSKIIVDWFCRFDNSIAEFGIQHCFGRDNRNIYTSCLHLASWVHLMQQLVHVYDI